MVLKDIDPNSNETLDREPGVFTYRCNACPVLIQGNHLASLQDRVRLHLVGNPDHVMTGDHE